MMATTSNESTTRNPVFNLLDRETVRITSHPRHEDESEPTVSWNLQPKEYLREESMPTISDQSISLKPFIFAEIVELADRGDLFNPAVIAKTRGREREREKMG